MVFFAIITTSVFLQQQSYEPISFSPRNEQKNLVPGKYHNKYY